MCRGHYLRRHALRGAWSLGQDACSDKTIAGQLDRPIYFLVTFLFIGGALYPILPFFSCVIDPLDSFHLLNMVRFSLTAAFFAATALAIPNPLTPDPSGAKNIGNGHGVQFIGGACLSSRDCASACCAILSGAGICSGVGAQFQAGKQGCGFGDGRRGAAPPPAPAPPRAAPAAPPANGVSSGVNQGAAGSQNVGKGNGRQFITGQCLSDADCASGCCAGPKGACSAAAVANENGKTGCGFVAA
ncbi:hypothetical protein CTA2_5338 [Colletotrichum tanaceti]|uniref:Biotrophy-associated secreted protein 2 n=1 Tax=Colletotrichum tanaceti TaxID=1306861 RepID=A0A4U6XC87_9PEZI|nr:hypothetical protein CTA2_5338 [Colletotrichum tanaceti]TKW53341.1 hypothetical protein CTA1_2544 [Colletotrichum tanaceti]